MTRNPMINNQKIDEIYNSILHHFEKYEFLTIVLTEYKKPVILIKCNWGEVNIELKWFISESYDLIDEQGMKIVDTGDMWFQLFSVAMDHYQLAMIRLLKNN